MKPSSDKGVAPLPQRRRYVNPGSRQNQFVAKTHRIGHQPPMLVKSTSKLAMSTLD